MQKAAVCAAVGAAGALLFWNWRRRLQSRIDESKGIDHHSHPRNAKLDGCVSSKKLVVAVDLDEVLGQFLHNLIQFHNEVSFAWVCPSYVCA